MLQILLISVTLSVIPNRQLELACVCMISCWSNSDLNELEFTFSEYSLFKKRRFVRLLVDGVMLVRSVFELTMLVAELAPSFKASSCLSNSCLVSMASISAAFRFVSINFSNTFYLLKKRSHKHVI